MPMTPDGFKPDSPADKLEVAKKIIKKVFGKDADVTPSSRNGQLIQEMTNIFIENENVKSWFYMGLLDPEVANGRMLEVICHLLNIKKHDGIQSSVICQVTGLPNLTIPKNCSILNNYGDIFINPQPIQIDNTGYGEGIFIAEKIGKIPCYKNTVNRVVQTLSGWDTVNNREDGEVGQESQTDEDLRQTRKYRLSLNSHGMESSIISSLYNIKNVQDVFVYNNNTINEIEYKGIKIPPRSCYIVVYGEQYNDVEIAKAIALKTSCLTFGEIKITFQDEKYTWQSYTAHFSRAVKIQIYIKVILKKSEEYLLGIDNIIKDKIQKNILYGDKYYDKIHIAQLVYTSRFINALLELGVKTVIDIQISTGADKDWRNYLNLQHNQVPAIELNNIFIEYI